MPPFIVLWGGFITSLVEWQHVIYKDKEMPLVERTWMEQIR